MAEHVSLNPDQARRIHDALRPTGSFLRTLRARMSELGFSPADDVFRAVVSADRALDDVLVRTRGVAHLETSAASDSETEKSNREN